MAAQRQESQQQQPSLEGMSLTEIARVAGVSVATVSRVVNKSTLVRPRTAQLVWQAVDSMRQEARGRSGARAGGELPAMVAMAFLGRGSFSALMPVFLELVAGIGSELRELGVRMLFSEVRGPEEVESQLHPDDIGGAITLVDDTLWDAGAVAALARRVPLVRVMGPPTTPAAMDHLMPDHRAIGEMAFSYLRSRGCESVSFMFVPRFAPRVAPIQMERAMSFTSAARAADVPVDFYLPEGNEAAARTLGVETASGTTQELVERFVRTRRAGTGLFVSTDQEAAQLYPLLQAAGVRPMVDVPIISCDNETPTLAALDPRPATMDILPQEIGRQAVRRLLQRIARPGDPPLQIRISPRLVEPVA